ncbi:hypothetical protein CAOG_03071 [Capsaspora owczarzaki ATCC 30864]|uniref:UBX domain-containing protein 1 n=1 Tax=Capsaspora owczarzaki (strain ATCC 30864) TaxID=595528 RepID=A0A0D2X269_CAPO3|nr:hypothetical protein CAOG_03071 [Capsaspora owczarzaki ATCC 30864]KJE92039.1 hypothetical protein, variant [Capsaspora owczarzaki ATCC 30864]|eukprot:XP_004363910.1 hypothetical protein CAOG_03071 [Capsaspora owczarzaki ATCC 30864]
MSSALESLIDMGFPRNRAEKALAVTGNQGAQAAMDWIFAHMDDPDIDEPHSSSSLSSGSALGSATSPSSSSSDAAAAASGEQAAAVPPEQARSLVCLDCNKKLRSELDAQAHAARTQHQNFAESSDEIKPLTEAEKQEQLARVEQRLKEARAAREAAAVDEERAKEKARRMQGKDMGIARKQFEEQEMQKALEARKREKEEEIKAKQRVREMIEQDKRARLGQSATPAAAAAPTPAAAAPAAVSAAPKEYTTASLQIRLTNGQAIKNTFDAGTTLSEVAGWVQLNRTDGQQPFAFMTNFPKRVFADAEYMQTLKELGLVPSSVLILTQPR